MASPLVPPAENPASPGVVIRPGARAPRQPLGLPAGSVRALLTFMVLGLIWALMLFPEEKQIKIPLYLYYLMFLILGHFFAAHGHTIAGSATETASPLYLPSGTLRTLIILGFLAVFGYRYYIHPNVEDFLKLQEPDLKQSYLSLPLVMVVGFFFGVFLNRVVIRAVGITPWFQDILAWVALLATLALAIDLVIQLIINPSLDPERRLDLGSWHLILSAIVSFYFGARS